MKALRSYDLDDVTAGLTATINDIKPLQGVLTKALVSVGIKPPTDLLSIAQSFSENVIGTNPSGTPALVNAIVGYVNEQVGALKSGQTLGETQKIVATGGIKVTSGLTIQKKISDFATNNPLITIGVVLVVVVAVGMWLMKKI